MEPLEHNTLVRGVAEWAEYINEKRCTIRKQHFVPKQ